MVQKRSYSRERERERKEEKKIIKQQKRRNVEKKATNSEI